MRYHVTLNDGTRMDVPAGGIRPSMSGAVVFTDGSKKVLHIIFNVRHVALVDEDMPVVFVENVPEEKEWSADSRHFSKNESNLENYPRINPRKVP